MDQMQPRIERLTYTMPPEQLSATVTQDLYTLAEKAGVHIREIKPLRAKTLKSGSLARVPLEVRFRAPISAERNAVFVLCRRPGQQNCCGQSEYYIDGHPPEIGGCGRADQRIYALLDRFLVRGRRRRHQ